MANLRPFRATDLFAFNSVNLDHWTETYSIAYYLSYLATWPDLSFTQLTPSGKIMGYVIGKAEGQDTETLGSNKGISFRQRQKQVKERHGHVTAITVAPEYRRLGVAKGLMRLLEQSSADVYNAFFVDLFVRQSNTVAVGMYEGMGYSVYRRVAEYYQGGGKDGGDEDAYDMRRAMPRDTRGETVRSGQAGRNVVVSPESTVFQPAHKPR